MFSLTQEAQIRDVLAWACTHREVLFLTTPYVRFESRFLALEDKALVVQATMTHEEATFGLRTAKVQLRFVDQAKFLEGTTHLLGYVQAQGQRTLRLAIPTALRDDNQRQAFRVERVGKVDVTFSTPRYDLHSGDLTNISMTGARLRARVDSMEARLKVADAIALNIPLGDRVRVDGTAVVRWIQGRGLGLEFQALEPEVLAPLSRWIFLKREEERGLVGAGTLRHAPLSPPGSGGLVLVSMEAAFQRTVNDLLTDLSLVRRVAPTAQAMREVAASAPRLVFFHVQGPGLDERRRLKTLVDLLGSSIPFVLLGTNVEDSLLFDLGADLKPAAVYNLGTKPSPFFSRLVAGILRRHEEPG